MWIYFAASGFSQDNMHNDRFPAGRSNGRGGSGTLIVLGD